MKRAHTILIIIVLLLSTAFAGCLSQQKDTPSPQSDTDENRIAKIAFGAVTTVSNTNINDAQYDRLIRVFCLQGLARIGPSGALEQELAKSWQVSPDLKKWTFQLFDNATWSDGKPVTSGDVKFTIENLARFTPHKMLYTENIESIETPDASTVVINLRKPDANLLYTWNVVKMLPEHVYKDVRNISSFNGKEASIGSGPYIFEKYDRNAGLIVFKANENYWEGKPSADIIEYRMYKNTDTLIQAFLKGEIDAPARPINYYYVPKILQEEGLGIMTAKNNGVSLAIYFNVEKPPYDSKVFREAMSYTINYDEMMKLFTAGYGSIPPAGWIPEGLYGYVETRPLAYDVNKSKALLDSMGMVDRDGDGFREMPDGTRFQGEITARSDIADHVRAAEMLKKYFNTVGIDIKFKWIDLSTFDALTGATEEMILSSTSYFGISMGAGYGTGLIGTGEYAWCMLNETKYNSLADQLSMVGDEDTRLKLGGELQKYYAYNLPMITVYSMDLIQPYNKRYTGWVVGSSVLNYHTLMELKTA